MEKFVALALEKQPKPPKRVTQVTLTDFSNLEERVRELKMLVDTSLHSIFVGQRNEVRMAI